MAAAAARTPSSRQSPLAAFIARTEARALLYAAGELTLHEAVDELHRAAERTGLAAAIDQDAVQKIMADAFAVARKLER
jgi:EAL domain-containing protein (putative c-di-GMP-specific phosphodiesterase class I)